MATETSADCARCARSTHPFLRGLGEAALAWLRDRKRDRVYASGAVLFRQGEEADEVFCLSGGIVKLEHAASTGRDVVVGLVGCGEVAGLSAALGPGTHPYTARVVRAGRFGLFPRAALLELAERQPGFALALAGQVAREAHRGVRQAALLSEPRLAPKLAALLLELGRGACGAEVGGGLTRRDLAACCGAGEEAVVRCLSRWRREGLIGSQGGPITLLDSEALAALAGA